MRKLSLTISTLFFSLVLGGLIAHAAASDENKFTIHPTYTHQGNKNWIITKAQPEETITEFLTLENLSENTQHISLLAKEANNIDNNFKPIEKEAYKNIGTWIKLPQSSYTIEAHGKIKIPFTFTIPKNTKPQEYTGVIYAVKEQTNAQNIKVVTRLGVRIYLEVGTFNTLSTNIFNTTTYKNTLFFGLSLIGFLGALFYHAIILIEKRKYAK